LPPPLRLHGAAAGPGTVNIMAKRAILV